MGDVQLLQGPADPGAPGCLFHTGAFFDLDRTEAGRYLRWERSGAVRATLHLSDAGGGLWRSPGRGTFAGPAWAPDVALDEADGFLSAVESELATAGATALEVLLPPMAHDPEDVGRSIYLLTARGWATTRCDLNQSIAVDARPLAERMNRANAKRSRKCARSGLVAERLPTTCLPQVYDVLRANRAAAGLELSMPLDALQRLDAAFPGALELFGCREGEQLVAAAVCLRLSPAVLYVFYWGHLPSHGALSPVVPLAESIYRHCQQERISTLDLGTSTIAGEPNLGLLSFKRGLGCEQSLKVRMRKALT